MRSRFEWKARVAAATLAATGTVSGTARAELEEGTHDYRGSLDGRNIAVHLSRRGAAIDGTYVYDAVGKEIALEGAMGADGWLALNESVDGRTTGAFRLLVEEAVLFGSWRSPVGAKVYPVSLVPSAPWVTTFTRRAERCLASVTCPAAEASRLFVAADDAHEELASCYRFLDGAGVPRDPVRGRACLERQVAREGACQGDSALLARAELATARIDGVGGARDVGGARALLEGCAEDLTRSEVLAHAKDVERSPATQGSVSFCRDLGGTRLTSDECAMRSRDVERTAQALEAKAVAAHLDFEGRRLLAAANEAFSAYVHALGALAYETYIDGSIRSSVSLRAEEAALAERTDALKELPAFVAPDASTLDAAAAEQATAKALALVHPWSRGEATALAATQSAWSSYRDAEVALYVHAFGAAQGDARVKAAVTVQLEERRAKRCAPPLIGPD